MNGLGQILITPVDQIEERRILMRREIMMASWENQRNIVLFGFRQKQLNRPIESRYDVNLISEIKRGTMSPILSGVRWPGRRAINDDLEYGDDV